MDLLVRRLHHFAREGSAPINDACSQAADEIERLQAAFAELEAEFKAAGATREPWRPIETVPESGLFLVQESGTMRTMLRECGHWLATATAIDEWGDVRSDIRVRETGVYNPTYYQELPAPPSEDKT